MRDDKYLFDTHALLYWYNRTNVSDQFIDFFDEIVFENQLYVSAISFWEIALLVKKKRLNLSDVIAWKNELLNNTNLLILNPSINDMIKSASLPDIHKDPFDRILITQATENNLLFVTQDQKIQLYEITCFWINS